MSEIYYTPHLFKRTLALLVDRFLFFIFLWPSFINNLGLMIAEKKIIISVNFLVGGFLISLLAKVCFYYFVGATPGKLLFGLRLKSINKGNENLGLTLVQCALRVLTDELSLFLGEALKCLALFRLDRRHFSDWIAETQVVQLVPLSSPTQRRWVLATILFAIQLRTGVLRSYQVFQHAEIKNGKITFSEWLH